MPAPEPRRFVPQPTPETQPFWDGTKAGELRLQRCDACAHVYFPPRPFCPKCAEPQGQLVRGQRPRDALQLRHPSPARARASRRRIRSRWSSWQKGPRMMTNIVELPADAGGAAARHAARGRVHEDERRDRARRSSSPASRGESPRHETEDRRDRRRRRNHRARRDPEHLAARAALRRRAERARRRRPQAERHRRRGDRGRVADQHRLSPRHHADLRRRHQRRRLLVHAARAPRGGGDQRRPVQHRADHARRERQVATSAAAASAAAAASLAARPVRDAVRPDGPAHALHAPGAALHEDVRRERRAAGDGRGDPARVGGARTRAPRTAIRSRSRTCSARA